MSWWSSYAEEEVLNYLRRIDRKLSVLVQMEVAVAGEIDELKLEVEENTSVTASAVTLLQGLKVALDEAIANDDMEAVRELRNQLDANNAALAAAVVANTPAAPPAPAPNP